MGKPDEDDDDFQSNNSPWSEEEQEAIEDHDWDSKSDD
jgi:hypothetical protein